MQENTPTPYSINKHVHCFAAWAASRAASVKGCRFSVERGRNLIEQCEFYDFSTPEELPAEIDNRHRDWRNKLCDSSRKLKKEKLIEAEFTHGVAAKLINVYLKARFVCSGHHLDPKVAALHPPIDKLLLESLAKNKFGDSATKWRKASLKGWSKLNSEEYDDLIVSMRQHLKGKPFWMIEEFWKGHQ